MSLAVLEQALILDVKPAYGCTEPVTIALAAAHAARQSGGVPTAVRLRLSANLFKNAMEVGIPNTNGGYGIALAAALGASSRRSKLDLNLLSEVSTEHLETARQLVTRDVVQVALEPKRYGLFIDAFAESPSGSGRAVIGKSHENIELLEANGRVVFAGAVGGEEKPDPVLAVRKALAELPFSEILRVVAQLPLTRRDALRMGVTMNRRVAEAGLQGEGRLRIGTAFQDLMGSGWLGADVTNKAKMLTSAAVDARMSGCSLPVMTSAGSGNQGLTITLPLAILAEKLESPANRLEEALALAHAVTSILKWHTGTLSAMCGCVVCSGTGLTVGAVHLLGGDLEKMGFAVNNMVGSITGIICDGAKVGCAVKLVCAVDAAFQSALMAMRGVSLPPTNGVLGRTLEQSLENLGKIAAPGMIETDDQILAIMMGKPV